jgi:hypothetical protein
MTKRKPQPAIEAPEITPAHEVMTIEFVALEAKEHLAIIGEHLADGWQIAGWTAVGGLRSVLLVRVPRVESSGE